MFRCKVLQENGSRRCASAQSESRESRSSGDSNYLGAVSDAPRFLSQLYTSRLSKHKRSLLNTIHESHSQVGTICLPAANMFRLEPKGCIWSREGGGTAGPCHTGADAGPDGRIATQNQLEQPQNHSARTPKHLEPLTSTTEPFRAT